jgi:hypothetical protein
MSDDLRLSRATMDAVQWLAAAIMDDEKEPDWRRDVAAELFRNIGEVFKYQEDGRSAYWEPAAFHVKDFYSTSASLYAAGLPQKVLEERAVQVLLLRQAAELVDSQEFSVGFTREALVAMDEIGQSLARAVEEAL